MFRSDKTNVFKAANVGQRRAEVKDMTGSGALAGTKGHRAAVALTTSREPTER